MDTFIFLKEAITATVKSPNDARKLIKQLARLDWQEIIVNRPQREVWRCAYCEVEMEQHLFEHFCTDCYSVQRSEAYAPVLRQRKRARDLGLPATLTFREWLQTLEYFQDSCAYCQKHLAKKDIHLEHFLPVKKMGGTTKANCIPACFYCNSKKGNRHPDELDGLFPSDNLARIRSYLASVS